VRGFVYILYSQKLNKYYIGSTTDIERRVEEHNRGKEKFTSTGLPWKLVYNEEYDNLTLARQRERFIKKMKSRIFIENMIKHAG
jgi:putative endonuclease